MVELRRKGNTEVWHAEGMTIVKYHRTNVVKFNEDVIILNTGGWFTLTTKQRMNQTAEEYGLDFRVASGPLGFEVYHNPDGRPWEPGTIVHDYSDRENILVIDRKEYL